MGYPMSTSSRRSSGRARDSHPLTAILNALPPRHRHELLTQLKVFYLVAGLYLAEHAASLHEAHDRLEEEYWDDVAREDLPISVRSLSRAINGLSPLLGTALGNPDLKLLITKGRKPARFGQDAVTAWQATEACLRDFLPPDWFGFSRISPSVAQRSPARSTTFRKPT